MKKKDSAIEPLYLTQEKYELLEKKLIELKGQRTKLGVVAKQANANIANDSFHTTSRDAFLGELQRLNNQIDRIKRDLYRAEITEKTNHYKRVNLGDIIRVKCTFLDEEPEEMVIRLVSYVDGKKDRYQDGIMSISTSSDLGRILLHQLVGETLPYGDGNTVSIMEKLHNPDLVNVGDVIEVEYEQIGYYKEPLTILLVEDLPKKRMDGIYYTSITSPMGKAIYNCGIGEERVYQTQNGTHQVKVLGKQSLENYQKSRSLTK
ncbi:MAG: hypothetical protein HFI09_05315 [Bacilli bacterium]|nr:hypothetical protein [Bacilli bacterium]